MSEGGKQQFSNDEAEAILREAARIDRAFDSTQLTRQSLIDTAAELGISPEAVQEAEKRVSERQVTDLARQEFSLHCAQKMREKIVSWASVSVMLIGINFFTSGFEGHVWFIYPVGIWGVVVLSEYISYRMNPPERDQSKFEDWLRERSFKTAMVKNYSTERSAVNNAAQLLDQYFNIHPLDDKIGAIKAVRESCGLSLKDAKSLVDAYFRARGLS